MVKAVAHCHSHDIIHRDVKLENFLIDVPDDSNIENEKEFVVKLTDFGLATKFDQENPPTQKCGSVITVAPEMLSKSSYGPKVDIWALGMILYELLTTKVLFYDEDLHQHFRNIVR